LEKNPNKLVFWRENKSYSFFFLSTKKLLLMRCERLFKSQFWLQTTLKLKQFLVNLGSSTLKNNLKLGPSGYLSFPKSATKNSQTSQFNRKSLKSLQRVAFELFIFFQEGTNSEEKNNDRHKRSLNCGDYPFFFEKKIYNCVYRHT